MAWHGLQMVPLVEVQQERNCGVNTQQKGSAPASLAGFTLQPLNKPEFGKPSASLLVGTPTDLLHL